MSKTPASCHRLDKALFAAGAQCAKRLYQEVHTPESVPAPGVTRQAFADIGIKLTAMACEGFPRGEHIEEETHEAAVEKTLKLLDSGDGAAIFNAAFCRDGVEVSCDVVLPGRGAKELDIFEVKSGTKVKPRHIMDIALQMWVIEGHDYEVSNASLLHLDAEYRHDGSQDFPVHKLFKNVDVTRKARKRKRRIPDYIENFQSVLNDESTLDLPTGTWCINPIPCGYLSECNKANEQRSLIEFPDLTATQETKLHQAGIETIEKIDPDAIELTPVQARALRAVESDTLVVEPIIKEEFETVVYPICFTSVNLALQILPQSENSRPWQHTPYQWSAHILHEDGKIEHRHHLVKSPKDPRNEFVASLLDCIDDVGTVVTWSKRLEPSLRKTMEDLPKIKEETKALLHMDPLPLDTLVREGAYHPKFLGSFELGDVHAALTGKPRPKHKPKGINNVDDARACFEKLANSRTRTATRTKLAEELEEFVTNQSREILEVFQALSAPEA